MNFKKVLAVLIMILMMSISLTSCGSSDSGDAPRNNPDDLLNESSDDMATTDDASTDDTSDTPSTEAIMEDIKSKGKLIVATEAGFPPMEYYDGDKIVGVDVDIVNAIAEKLGVEVEFLELEFNSLIPALNSGKAHLIAAGFSYNEERAEKVDFSDVYFKSMQVILTKDGSGIDSEESLSGKKVGAQQNTVGDIFITEDVDCEEKQFYKYMQAVEELKNGAIDAIVVDKVPAEVFVEQNEDLIISAELFEDEYGLGINKDQPEFLGVINETIKELQDSGKIDEFRDKHLKAE